MSDLMKGKVVAITGAASGIGLECARTLLSEGAKVVLVDRAQDKLELLCKELGPNALPLVVDLLKPSEVSGMLPRILDIAGGLDVFHANAGACCAQRPAPRILTPCRSAPRLRERRPQSSS